MKILIVDDESFIRQGLKNNIDWKHFGIQEIMDADDGEKAVAMAREQKPDIILTDVRMPRLNGIEFCNQVRSFLPEVPIIIMSGFSDKEYLKAAIHLKAISYVEKPIDLKEINEALAESILQASIMKNNSNARQIQTRESQSRLAVLLSRPSTDEGESKAELIQQLHLDLTKETLCTTVVLESESSILDTDIAWLEERIHILQKKSEQEHVQLLYSFKYDHFILFHLYSNSKDSNVFSCVHSLFSDFLCDTSEKYVFTAAIGSVVEGYEKLADSYSVANILLESSFFSTPGHIIREKHTRPYSPDVVNQCVAAFTTTLDHSDYTQLDKIMSQLYDNLIDCVGFLPSQAKDLYFRLLAHIESLATKKHITLPEQGVDNSWTQISAARNLSRLHDLLHRRLNDYLNSIAEQEKENPQITMIKEYVRRHYESYALSVKDIADYVGLTTTYVCTLFKNETNITINQYISDYRIERAKRLLEDPRNKISDIAEKIGYSDSNYFGKSFKKLVGLTPSEYREKLS